jgi:4a-hydroxytetrahydrobiopterin dehydratase
MVRRRLEDGELQSALQLLNGWALSEGKLHREYRFPDFAHAFGFMSTASIYIEKMNHHPDWSNVYNRVVVDLTTHDAGGVTQNDIELARRLDTIANKLA